MKNITKDQFVGLLKDAGITEAQMAAMHQLFEKRHPAQHQSFLEYLGISASEVAEIRGSSVSK